MTFRYATFKFCLPAVLGLAVLAVILSAPAFAQSQAQWNSLYDRIIRLEAAVRNMQGQGAGAQLQNPQSAAQINLRIGSLEDQVRRLLGTIERLNHEVRGLNEQVRRSRQDNAFRFRQLEQAARQGRLRGKLKKYAHAGNSNRPATLAPLPNQPGTTAHTGGLPVYDPNEMDKLIYESGPTTDNTDPDPVDNNSSPSQAPATGPTSLGTIQLNQSGKVTGGTIGATPGSNATINPNAVEKLTLDGEKVASLTPGSGPDLVYEQAYENMLQRRFGAAEAGFEMFLSKHKSHRLASKAQYWLGETHYARKDYKSAARTFLIGYKTHKKSAMAPQSLVKLGMSLRRLGQKSSACATFAQVRSEFPKTKSVRKLAGKEARRAGC